MREAHIDNLTLNRRFLLVALCVLTGRAWAAQDPFVGEWKLNPAKSRVIDIMKVVSVGGNKFDFDFGGGPETIVADGTDQPGVYGTMLAVTVEGPDTWKVVRKKDGRVMLTANWKLSPDGTGLTDNYTEYGPKGEPSTVDYHFHRTDGGSGFVGTWESVQTESAYAFQIRPYENKGLSLVRGAAARNLKLDGKDYPNAGGDAAQSSTSARRVSDRILETTDKVNGKITRTEHIELSPDLKTMTRTIYLSGQHDPSILVFERQ